MSLDLSHNHLTFDSLLIATMAILESAAQCHQLLYRARRQASRQPGSAPEQTELWLPLLAQLGGMLTFDDDPASAASEDSQSAAVSPTKASSPSARSPVSTTTSTRQLRPSLSFVFTCLEWSHDANDFVVPATPQRKRIDLDLSHNELLKLNVSDTHFTVLNSTLLKERIGVINKLLAMVSQASNLITSTLEAYPPIAIILDGVDSAPAPVVHEFDWLFSGAHRQSMSRSMMAALTQPNQLFPVSSASSGGSTVSNGGHRAAAAKPSTAIKTPIRRPLLSPARSPLPQPNTQSSQPPRLNASASAPHIEMSTPTGGDIGTIFATPVRSNRIRPLESPGKLPTMSTMSPVRGSFTSPKVNSTPKRFL